MKEEFISNRQLLFIVFMMQIGTRVLSLPYVEAEYAGIYGWIAVLLGGIAAQLGILLIWMLGKRYPNQNFFQYVYTIAGRQVGSVFTFLLAVYFIYSALIVSVVYIENLNRWVLQITPWWIMLLLIFSVSGYAAISSLRVLSFISISLVPIVFLGFILIIFSGVQNADIRNLLPLGHSGGSSFAYGVYQGYSACLGYELLLYAFPYVRSQSSRKILGTMTLANGLTTFFYVSVVLICSLNFSTHQISKIPEPIVFIIKQIGWDVIQSIDILFIIMWFTIISSTVYIYLFLAAKAISYLGAVNKGMHIRWVWVCTGICYLIGCWLQNQSLIKTISGKPYEIYGIVCLVFLPLLLLLVSNLLRLKERQI